MQVVPASVFVEKEFETPRDIVGNGILGWQAFTLITGPGGVGKSLFAMQLAWHVASGLREFLGAQVYGKHRVLLLQKELSPYELQRRLRTQTQGHAPSELYILEDVWDFRLSPVGQTGPLDSVVGELDPRVVVLDPLAQLSSVRENDPTETQLGVIQHVQRWMSQGRSVVLVHHHSKGNEEFPRVGTDRVRGATALSDSCDTNIQLIPENKEKGLVTLSFEKLRRWAPVTSLDLAIDQATLSFYTRDVTAGILRHLQAGPLTMDDLIKHLKHLGAPTTVVKRVYGLKDAGVVQVVNVADGSTVVSLTS